MIPARVRRVCETCREVLGEIIQKEIKDPRIGFVTVTEVEMSADLRHARIWVSVLGTREEADEAMKALEGARGFIRAELGKRVRLRYLPEVTFMRDESCERSQRLEGIFRALREEASRGGGGGDEQGGRTDEG